MMNVVCLFRHPCNRANLYSAQMFDFNGLVMRDELCSSYKNLLYIVQHNRLRRQNEE